MKVSAFERGATLLETAIYMALLSVVALAFVSMTSATLRVERHAIEGNVARAEADRLYELVAGELRRASLATVSAPLPGASGAALTFRRVTAIVVSPSSGLPEAVLEPDPATFTLAGQDLVREQTGTRVLLSTAVTEFQVERVGVTPSFRLRIEVTARGADVDRTSRMREVRVAVAEGTVLASND
jgi:hypothetical protein